MTNDDLNPKGLEAAHEAYGRYSSRGASDGGLPAAIRAYLAASDTPAAEPVPTYWHNGAQQIISHKDRLELLAYEPAADYVSRFDEPLYTHPSPSPSEPGQDMVMVPRDSVDDSFDKWWADDGQFIDPDTSDVPWFDKRRGLAEAAFKAGRKA